MFTELSTAAVELGTYCVTAAFTDENDDAVVPSSINWSLIDLNGKIINSRNEVSIGAPASSIDIVLSGDDLEIRASERKLDKVHRLVLVEAVFDSDLGSDLPLNDQCQFPILNTKKAK